VHKTKIESKAMEEMCPKSKKTTTKKQRVELGNERSAHPHEFHFTFRLKRNNGKKTYLPL
jgi:hypothetical protein